MIEFERVVSELGLDGGRKIFAQGTTDKPLPISTFLQHEGVTFVVQTTTQSPGRDIQWQAQDYDSLFLEKKVFLPPPCSPQQVERFCNLVAGLASSS